MTRMTEKNKIRTPNTVPSSSSDPMHSKTPSDSAILAQQLGSESSWADRYVPATPGETIMTPASSVADHSEHAPESEYMTPNEAPPSYEEVTTSQSGRSQAPSYPRDLPSAQQPQTQPLQRPQLPGRHYSRHETFQSITGTFTLYDSLDLSTSSGSINIKLDVQPGSEPARLNLKSSSGSITVNDKRYDVATGRSRQSSSCNDPGSRSTSSTGGSSTGLLSFLWGSRGDSSSNASTQENAPPVPFSDDPRKQPGQHLQREQEASSTTGPRVIHTTIETASGGATGHLLLTPTSITNVKTTAGSIRLNLVTSDSASPRAPLDKLSAEDSRNRNNINNYETPSCTLTTTSASGSQNISIVTGTSDLSSGKLSSEIRASHHALGSSSIRCEYPREWQGLVHASVGGSGNVNVKGEGLQFDRRGNKEVWAWRGPEGELPDIEGAVQVRGDGSGSLYFGC